VFLVAQLPATILVVLQHCATLVDHFLNLYHAVGMVFLDANDRGL
jgi:hypothetical protein